MPASHGCLAYLRPPIVWVHKSLSPWPLATVHPSVNASRHRPDTPWPCWGWRREGELLFRWPLPLCKDIRTAEGTAVIVDRVVSGEWVAVREEGHVALWLGQVIMQCSVAAGCNGATGKGAKNPLVVSLFNDRLFSPAPVKGGGEEEKRLETGKDWSSKAERSKEKRMRQKQQHYVPVS